jgi:predicted dehydrogenase
MKAGVLVVGADPSGRGFGARAHVPAVEAAPGLRLVGVCTSREETARAAGTRWGTRAFADYREAIAHPDVELVTIAVRVALHAEIAEAAVEAGRPVYCEWPLATDSRTAASLADAAERGGVATAVGTQGRYAPAVVAARDALARGDVGRPLAFQVEHQLARFAVESDRWWLARDEHGSGALHVATAHATDTLESLLGPIVAIAGAEATRRPDDAYADTGEPFTWTAADTVAYTARLADGTIGSALVANVADPAPGFALRILGDEGVLQLDAPGYASYAPARLLVGRSGASLEPRGVSAPPGIPLPADNPARNVALALGAFAEQGASFRPAFRDAARLHRLLEAIVRSSAERVWVEV